MITLNFVNKIYVFVINFYMNMFFSFYIFVIEIRFVMNSICESNNLHVRTIPIPITLFQAFLAIYMYLPISYQILNVILYAVLYS